MECTAHWFMLWSKQSSLLNETLSGIVPNHRTLLRFELHQGSFRNISEADFIADYKSANIFALEVGFEPTTHGLVSMNVLATFCLRVIPKFLSRLFPCDTVRCSKTSWATQALFILCIEQDSNLRPPPCKGGFLNRWNIDAIVVHLGIEPRTFGLWGRRF